jgi:S-adenosylmethionine:tRNA ribosyltransferase-isomerase
VAEMKLSDFDYSLPEELIATRPVKNRDESRLLVFDKNKSEIEDKKFTDVLEYLKPGDVLVLNDSKVFPARLVGVKKTGGRAEILLNREAKDGWQALSRGLKVDQEIYFETSDLIGKVIKKEDKEILISFNFTGIDFFNELERIGKIPLPPYIEKNRKEKNDCDDKKRYQTVYAKNVGSCAAPTAGLHFTDSLLGKIRQKGVVICELTLHVGLGTFLPIETENIKLHKMHREYFSVPKETLDIIKNAKENNKKIFAVGTTTTRVLESVFGDKRYDLNKGDISDWTEIFIYPGYIFNCIDGLITNFHLPKSSLLLLISAFATREKILKIYNHAIDNKYRFYSYGDAMLII